MSKSHNILPTRDSFFTSSGGKTESVREFKVFRVAVSLRVTVIKIISSHSVVFNENAIL